VKLNSERAGADIDAGIRLLCDIRDVLDEDRMGSDGLLEGLLRIEEAPWSSLRRGALVDEIAPERRLKPVTSRLVGIAPLDQRGVDHAQIDLAGVVERT
jgi:hypothetical protein